jgi:hypothetical protein
MPHLEDYDPDENVDKQYIDSYGQDFSVHKLMLSDQPRMEFYQSAIIHALAKNKNKNSKSFVIDCGAGSGVLSMIALKAGAEKVYSIEASERIAQTISQNIKRNFSRIFSSQQEENIDEVVSKKWKLFQGMAETFPVEEVVNEILEISTSEKQKQQQDSPVRQDDDDTTCNQQQSDDDNEICIFLVSEWMGFYLLHEAMLQSVIFLRDALLKQIVASKNQQKGNRRNNKNNNNNISLRLIPDVAEIYCAPFDLRKHYESSVKPSWQFLDFDFSFLGEVDTAEIFSTERNPVVQVVHPNSILLPNQQRKVVSLNLEIVTVEELETLEFSAKFHYPEDFGKNNRNAALNGFVLWFSCFFEEKRFELATSPFATPTHWKQTVVMISDEGIKSIDLAGDEMTVKFTMQRDERSYVIGLELE